MTSDFRPLDARKEQQIKTAYKSLSEKDRRRFVASLSLTLPRGGCQYLSELLGCDPSTITRGRKELEQLVDHNGDPLEGRDRSPGAGRPRKEEQHPELEEELGDLLEQRTAGDPTDQAVNWTFLPVTEIRDLLCEKCVSVSWHVVKRLCDQRGLKKRQQVDSITKAPSRNRDQQFKIIDRLRSTFRSTKDAIFSIDSKQTEMLGDVSRPGAVLADGAVEMLDHPLPSYAQGEVVTHGIYDTQHNTAHMNLSLGHDTGAFAWASFRWFWEHIGSLVNEAADRILLLLDCGGSNSFRSNVFKYNLCVASAEIGLPIRVAHFPVYCSKYNPIERRVFPWVERAYSGQHFTGIEQMPAAIEQRATTSTGLTTTAHVMRKTFKPATKTEKKRAAEIEVEYPEELKAYNYRATPQILQ